MLNIIRSQLYAMKRDMYTYISLFVIGMLFAVLLISSLGNVDTEKLNGSSMFMVSNEFVNISAFFALSLFATRLCGWDFLDKTINYEVLYGQKRSSIFWGRTLPALFVSISLSCLLTFGPCLIVTIMHGWGYSVEAKEALIRSLLLVLSFLKISSFYVLMTIIFRNSWTALASSLAFLTVELLISLIFTDSGKYLMFFGIAQLLSFENVTLGFIDGEDVMVAVDTLSTGYIAFSVGMSIVLSAVMLIAAYEIFRRKDMD